MIELSDPSLKTFIAIPIFIVASSFQHRCHKYLSSLKKYTLPDDPLFRRVICPHYTSECLIYFAIGVVSAPKGQIMNGTVLAGCCFVVSNLAVTADSTKSWYTGKFGEESLKGRWRMIPYVY